MVRRTPRRPGELGATLRTVRTFLGLRLVEVAAAAEVAVPTICRLEVDNLPAVPSAARLLQTYGRLLLAFDDAAVRARLAAFQTRDAKSVRRRPPRRSAAATLLTAGTLPSAASGGDSA